MCDPSLTHAIPERLRDEQVIIKCYTNKASFTFYLFCLFCNVSDFDALMGN